MSEPNPISLFDDLVTTRLPGKVPLDQQLHAGAGLGLLSLAAFSSNNPALANKILGLTTGVHFKGKKPYIGANPYILAMYVLPPPFGFGKPQWYGLPPQYGYYLYPELGIDPINSTYLQTLPPNIADKDGKQREKFLKQTYQQVYENELRYLSVQSLIDQTVTRLRQTESFELRHDWYFERAVDVLANKLSGDKDKARAYINEALALATQKSDLPAGTVTDPANPLFARDPADDAIDTAYFAVRLGAALVVGNLFGQRQGHLDIPPGDGNAASLIAAEFPPDP